MMYSNEADIDARIRVVEDKLQHDTNTLKVEKELMAEIKELKKNKPKLAQLAQKQDQLSSMDFGGDLKAQKDTLNEQFGVLREKKKEISERLTELTEARKAQLGDTGEVAENRDKISGQIKELIAQRTQLRDEFNAQKKEFQAPLAEQRRIKQEKYA